MTISRKSAMQIFTLAFCLFAIPGAATAGGANSCKEPAFGSNKAPLLSPPRGNVVIGTGRLQFYSAPNEQCRMEGVFVIPGEELTSYAETDDGWTSVAYIGAKRGEASGWVRSARLKETGTMGPAQ